MIEAPTAECFDFGLKLAHLCVWTSGMKAQGVHEGIVTSMKQHIGLVVVNVEL